MYALVMVVLTKGRPVKTGRARKFHDGPTLVLNLFDALCSLWATPPHLA
jgi:hypothetical protein